MMREGSIAVIGIALALASPSAGAGGVENVRACEKDTGAPSDIRVMAAKDPNGNPRGTRSAAVLIGEARKATRGNRPDEAIAWAALCQWHDKPAAAEIYRDRDAVLKYLQ